jgi:hypothetical protein
LFEAAIVRLFEKLGVGTGAAEGLTCSSTPSQWNSIPLSVHLAPSAVAGNNNDVCRNLDQRFVCHSRYAYLT